MREVDHLVLSERRRKERRKKEKDGENLLQRKKGRMEDNEERGRFSEKIRGAVSILERCGWQSSSRG